MNEKYIKYLHNKIIGAEPDYEELEYYNSLFLKLSSREYMENGRSETKNDVLGNLINKLDFSSINGAVSSVLISHQIAEEWLYDLLELARFAVDLKMFPNRIHHKFSENLQLNGLVSEIEILIDFRKKQEVIKYAKLVNNYRNKIAHNLLKLDSIEAIKKEAVKFNEHFEKLYSALEGTDEDSFGARESLLCHIKNYHKWSDEFYDKYKDILLEIIEDLDINHLSQEEFELKTVKMPNENRFVK